MGEKFAKILISQQLNKKKNKNPNTKAHASQVL